MSRLRPPRRLLSSLLLALCAACTAPWPELTLTSSSSTGESSTGGEDSGGFVSGSIMTSTFGSTSGTGTTTTTDGSGETGVGSTGTTTTTTTTTGVLAVCGDGAVGPGEECDDGNGDDEDGCPSTCLMDRWVFVTAATHKPDFKGAAGADNLCRQYALQSGRAEDTWKTFVGWVSDSTSDVRDRLSPDVLARYVRTDGVVVAYGAEQFFSGTLEAPISVDEFGESYTGGVMTGTRIDGTAVPGSTHCDDWTVVDGGQFELYFGSAMSATERWTMNPDIEFNPDGCAGSRRIYCIQGG